MQELLTAYVSFLSNAVKHNGKPLLFFVDTGVLPSGTGAPQPPYATFTLTKESFGRESLDNIRFWAKGTNQSLINDFMQQLSDAIPETGVVLTLPNNRGSVWINRGQPWNTYQPSDDLTVRIGYCVTNIKSFIKN